MHTQLCLTLLDPSDCSQPGISVRGIFQARILEGFFRPRSWTYVSCLQICRQILYPLGHRGCWRNHSYLQKWRDMIVPYLKNFYKVQLIFIHLLKNNRQVAYGNYEGACWKTMQPRAIMMPKFKGGQKSPLCFIFLVSMAVQPHSASRIPWGLFTTPWVCSCYFPKSFNISDKWGWIASKFASPEGSSVVSLLPSKLQKTAYFYFLKICFCQFALGKS